jgi:hypothetical protein
MTSLQATYAPEDYPTPSMRAAGMVCGCSYFWTDPCRLEFRRVRALALHTPHVRPAPQNSAGAPVFFAAPLPSARLENSKPPSLLMQVFISSLDEQQVDAVIYPTWNRPPLLVGHGSDGMYDGNNSPFIAPHVGAPAITVPMGYSCIVC